MFELTVLVIGLGALIATVIASQQEADQDTAIKRRELDRSMDDIASHQREINRRSNTTYTDRLDQYWAERDMNRSSRKYRDTDYPNPHSRNQWNNHHPLTD
jgi:outer membrane lipoprotein-sorting protein